MNRPDKETFVGEFRAQVSDASVMYLADFSGLDVKSITQLRSDLRNTGAQFLVVKNRLAKLALAELDLPEVSDHLVGPTAFVLSTSDAAAPAKAITDFAKKHDDRPVFKVGVLDGNLLEAAAIQKIASLPSREQLLAEVAGAFEAPMAAFAGVLSALLQEFAGLLDALGNEKS